MSAQTYRLLNLLLLGALFAGSVMVYPRLPERFPRHFDLSGQPDAWEERSLVGWLLLPAVAAGVAALMELAARTAQSAPQLWNVPDKPRFLALTREEREPIAQRLRAFVALVGAASTALICVIQASVYHASVSPQPRMPTYVFAAIALHLGVLLAAGVRLNRGVSALIHDAYARRAAA
ncbi:MAG TPA: DUF1648 domain-containing protein [Longimicrobium sp.]|nr:DUF1648 domain-containing protein [Longimicrobium sp.]